MCGKQARVRCHTMHRKHPRDALRSAVDARDAHATAALTLRSRAISPSGPASAGAPQQLRMGGGGGVGGGGMAAPPTLNSMFQNDAITVQQTTRGCVQECCGCEAKSEYQ